MMNPTVMKMLTDAHMNELMRQAERQQFAEQAGYRGPWVTLLTALLVAAVIGSGWLA